MDQFVTLVGYSIIGLVIAAWVAPKILARVILFWDATIDRVQSAVDEIENGRAEKREAARQEYLLRVDVAELRKSKDLDAIITARQAEIAQARARETT